MFTATMVMVISTTIRHDPTTVRTTLTPGGGGGGENDDDDRLASKPVVVMLIRSGPLPNKTVVDYTKPFMPHGDSEDRREGAIRLAELLAQADGLYESHRRKALSNTIWWYTEADGKYATRYRSRSVCTGTTEKVQHEHVIPRATLVDLMMANPTRTRAILTTAIGCMVTESEHRRLTLLPAAVEGWARYKAAGIEVVDMTTGLPIDTTR